MEKVSSVSLREIREALARYRLEVETTQMTSATKRTYLLHAENFVRWLADDFNPGANVRRH